MLRHYLLDLLSASWVHADLDAFDNLNLRKEVLHSVNFCLLSLNIYKVLASW